LADGVAFLDALPFALVSPARRLRVGQAFDLGRVSSPLLRQVRRNQAQSRRESRGSALADGTLDDGGCQCVGIESFPEYACAEPHGPGAHAVREIHRRERFTPGTLSSPDVREIRWFLHLRYARDFPGKAPIQRSSANGRAISEDTSNAS